ncbi:hypothetical protein PISL3812_01649 [Talaromyces islandicus]|uniref:Uncharacterized protein n=1 Tax=Talaromyces islandicus TaxID=28573 RepID=A0A0U1LQ57_TALIS|nr:hypothetical protein PISL3812_01649 [Talaromyces islandicus]
MDQSQKKEDMGSRFLNRMGSVFRRKPRRTESTVSNIAVENTATPAATTIPTTTSGFQPTTTTTITASPAPLVARDATPVVQWSTVQQERARALFAKYGLTLEPEEWMSPRNLEVQRVEKPIRMRVRRTCHRCQTIFGSDKVCASCQHVRCKKCPRHPPARTKEEKDARVLAKAQGKGPEIASKLVAIAAAGAAGPVPAVIPVKKPKQPLTIPSRTGGQDLCENCAHIRCKKCPRDPPKLDKYPDGYPGDVDPPPERPQRVWRKPRMRVRYFCHQCENPLITGEQACSNCGQEKGPETRRDPPKKPKPELDPEVVRRVQERLASLQVNG